ncbi:pimeloyl-ACP methyl ester carboxylesterase [Pseudarthrobacter sp. PvP004]|uniref:alpha/beta hydrolase n=1 Tax=Pseudarthrobacter sp. PvP004 TaxID=2817850 RepID=UPI0027DE4A98|nr:alpha/beta hydrolase [Pseudarthrobacter sp. PvP004]MBP2268289.1 pimeloyl-ACP methyl ester carboxylesterase [Pseudarthrobacter sp. PvP004]
MCRSNATDSLVDAGFLVVILKTPLNLSLLDGRQALGVITEHPGVTNWAVGGHSLGGVSASTFALDHSAVSGLLLYGSYPLESRSRVTAKRRWTARWRKSRFLPPRWRS